MKQAKWALFVLAGGATLASLGALTTVACSSSGGSTSGESSSGGTVSGSSSGAASGSSSGGTVSGSSSGAASGSSSGGGTGSDAGEDAGTTACKIPSLHPNPAGDIFCGFTDAGDLSCLADSGTQQCCLGGTVATDVFAPEACAQFGTACTNGTKAVPIECGQVSDCATNGMPGAVCCLQGTTSGPAVVASCPATDLKQSGGTAIACEMTDAGALADDAGSDAGSVAVGACAAGELQVCAQQADCPSGKTCTAVHWKLYDLGFCM